MFNDYQFHAMSFEDYQWYDIDSPSSGDSGGDASGIQLSLSTALNL